MTDLTGLDPRQLQAEHLGRLLINPTQALTEAVPKALRTLDTIEVTIARMKADGTTDAAPHWRERKYLYLIHPMVNGERRREYIGADENKIQIALRRIERFKKVKQYEQDLAGYYRRCRQAVRLLEEALALLKPPDGW